MYERLGVNNYTQAAIAVANSVGFFGENLLKSDPERKIKLTNLLSAEEIEMLRLIAMGYSDEQIGEEYGYTQESMGNKISSINRRLSVSSRQRSVLVAIQEEALELKELVNPSAVSAPLDLLDREIITAIGQRPEELSSPDKVRNAFGMTENIGKKRLVRLYAKLGIAASFTQLMVFALYVAKYQLPLQWRK